MKKDEDFYSDINEYLDEVTAEVACDDIEIMVEEASVEVFKDFDSWEKRTNTNSKVLTWLRSLKQQILKLVSSHPWLQIQTLLQAPKKKTDSER